MNKVERVRLAVLGSGVGTNFSAIQAAIDSGELRNYAIKLVISDVRTAQILKRAEQSGIRAVFVDPKRFANKAEHEAAIQTLLESADIDLVCLAGYMRLLGRDFVRAFWKRITNLHPSLLPEFRGRYPLERAIAAGKRTVGATVHYVDEGMDTGEIIAQTRLRISSGASPTAVEQQLKPLEHRLYIRALQKIMSLKGVDND